MPRRKATYDIPSKKWFRQSYTPGGELRDAGAGVAGTRGARSTSSRILAAIMRGSKSVVKKYGAKSVVKTLMKAGLWSLKGLGSIASPVFTVWIIGDLALAGYRMATGGGREASDATRMAEMVAAEGRAEVADIEFENRTIAGGTSPLVKSPVGRNIAQASMVSSMLPKGSVGRSPASRKDQPLAGLTEEELMRARWAMGDSPLVAPPNKPQQGR